MTPVDLVSYEARFNNPLGLFEEPSSCPTRVYLYPDTTLERAQCAVMPAVNRQEGAVQWRGAWG